MKMLEKEISPLWLISSVAGLCELLGGGCEPLLAPLQVLRGVDVYFWLCSLFVDNLCCAFQDPFWQVQLINVYLLEELDTPVQGGNLTLGLHKK